MQISVMTLLLFQANSSFHVYTVYKEITPIGWIVIIGLPLVLIFGLGWLVVKFLKKSKLK
jgi:hypothetical protein